MAETGQLQPTKREELLDQLEKESERYLVLSFNVGLRTFGLAEEKGYEIIFLGDDEGNFTDGQKAACNMLRLLVDSADATIGELEGERMMLEFPKTVTSSEYVLFPAPCNKDILEAFPGLDEETTGFFCVAEYPGSSPGITVEVLDRSTTDNEEPLEGQDGPGHLPMYIMSPERGSPKEKDNGG